MRKKRGSSKKTTTARKITQMIFKIAVALAWLANFVLTVLMLWDRLTG